MILHIYKTSAPDKVMIVPIEVTGFTLEFLRQKVLLDADFSYVSEIKDNIFSCEMGDEKVTYKLFNDERRLEKPPDNGPSDELGGTGAGQ